MFLNEPIENLKKTRSSTILKLKKIGIISFIDLLNYTPLRYEDYSNIVPIAALVPGIETTIKVRVQTIRNMYTRSGLVIQKANVEDKSGTITVIWYNQTYLTRIVKSNAMISISGKLIYDKGATFVPYEYEIIDDLEKDTIHTGRIVPGYSEKGGLSSHLLREKLYQILHTPEFNKFFTSSDNLYLPDLILKQHNLVNLSIAYKNIHFPSNYQLLEQARKRLAFNELFTIKLRSQIIKKQWLSEKVKKQLQNTVSYKDKLNKFILNLPFKLTMSQEKAISEINRDLIKNVPMNRFLQGEVGSGKTVIAATAAYLTYLNGYQTLIMAPTAILAKQHYQTISGIFSRYKIKTGLITSNNKIELKSLKDYDIIIGTQALLNEKLIFKKLAFVVVDEQHRFGVEQRALLKKKGGNVHLLTMTATPIPRTVALTIFGELDLSYLTDMPHGRLPVKTFLVPPFKRQAAYQWMGKLMMENKIQTFIVCPLIETSTKETLKSIRAVTTEYELLKSDVFPQFNIGLLHGRLKNIEKNKIMDAYRSNQYQILVTTSVVEVGIDIPNATIIVIEGAERYGLAQLHQLRGRVGRSDKQAYCLLFTNGEDEKIKNRLNFFTSNNQGVKLAEYDLKTRGPGAILGVEQHGFGGLKIASYFDHELIQIAKEAAEYFINNYTLSDFPLLNQIYMSKQNDLISRD